jgi:hypothetical protein
VVGRRGEEGGCDVVVRRGEEGSCGGWEGEEALGLIEIGLRVLGVGLLRCVGACAVACACVAVASISRGKR